MITLVLPKEQPAATVVVVAAAAAATAAMQHLQVAKTKMQA